jgi:hypothetical protein
MNSLEICLGTSRPRRQIRRGPSDLHASSPRRRQKNEPLEVKETLERYASQLPEATWPIIAENLKQTALGKAKDGAFYLQPLLEMMTAANAPPPENMAPIPVTAGPYGSYDYPPAMGIAVVTPSYWDPNAPSYYQGQPYGAFPAYGAPLPVSGPVVAPPQAPPPPIATSPVPITDWKDGMSACVGELLSRLHDGDKVKVGLCFDLLREIARKQKFTGDDLDGLIAAALEDRTLEQLVLIDNYAKVLLPEENLLAASMRLGIARMLLPMKFVEAVIQEEPKRWSIAGEELRKCCNPAKRNDPKPTEGEAKSMMQKMLERVLDRVSSRTLLLLNQRTATDPQDDPAMLVLMLLLEGKYARAIADAETNI